MALRPTAAKRKTKATPSVDFGSLRDWETRLNGCTVFYKDLPFVVQKIRRKKSVEMAELKALYDIQHELYRKASTDAECVKHMTKLKALGEKMKKLEIKEQSSPTTIEVVGYTTSLSARGLQKSPQMVTSPDQLDLSFKNLGFVNLKDRAMWVGRMAGQQWRHGLYKSNIVTSSITPSEGRPPKGLQPSDPDFMKMLLRSYPTLTECLDMLYPLEGTNSQAFCLNYAVQVDAVGHVTLWRHKVQIGASTNEGESFKLLGRYAYRKEALIKEGVKIDT